jgi:hypothetical protein
MSNLIMTALWIIIAAAVGLYLFRLFKSVQKREQTLAQIRLSVRQAMQSGSESDWQKVRSLRTEIDLNSISTANTVILQEWAARIKCIPFDSGQTEASIHQLINPIRQLGFDAREMGLTGVGEKLLEFDAFEDLTSGKHAYPAGPHFEPEITLKPNERLVFKFSLVSLIKNVNHRHYVGQSSGMSVRVAKGLYARTGVQSGTSYSEKVKEVVDHGELYVTTQAVIFLGKDATPRIPFQKIVAVDELPHALQIAQEGKEPFVFVVGDPLFAKFVIQTLMNMKVNRKANTKS